MSKHLNTSTSQQQQQQQQQHKTTNYFLFFYLQQQSKKKLEVEWSGVDGWMDGWMVEYLYSLGIIISNFNEQISTTR